MENCSIVDRLQTLKSLFRRRLRALGDAGQNSVEFVGLYIVVCLAIVSITTLPEVQDVPRRVEASICKVLECNKVNPGLEDAEVTGGGSFTGSGKGAAAVRAAMQWLGTPYSWGGGGPNGPSYGIEQGANTNGFDCSGLTEYAWYQATGKSIGSTTVPQSSFPGQRITDMNQLQPGDLMFFSNDGTQAGIHHVALAHSPGNMVHAPRTGDVVKVERYAGNSYYTGEFVYGIRPAI